MSVEVLMQARKSYRQQSQHQREVSSTGGPREVVSKRAGDSFEGRAGDSFEEKDEDTEEASGRSRSHWSGRFRVTYRGGITAI